MNSSRVKKWLATLFVMLYSVQSAESQNLLVNGNFESGGNNVGFNINGAGYTLLTPPYSGTTSPGNYAFTTSPQLLNYAYFLPGGDHTTGSGNMLVIDGNTTGGAQRFWRAGNNGSGVCGLTPGVTYVFGYWIKSVSTSVTNTATRADIGVQITNASGIVPVVGGPLAPFPANGWQQVAFYFTATANCVTIELWNNNTNSVGNDFAVDDFYLTPMPGCTPPASTPVLFITPTSSSSVYVDWNNAGQSNFLYSYTINDGPPITGSMTAPSSMTINNLPEGAVITFTLTWVGLCTPPLTVTTAVLCSTLAQPGFAPIAPICAGSTPPVLSPVSPSGVNGTWFPSVINNSTSGSYVFTPAAGQCVAPQTLNVTVNPTATPTFNLPTQICQNQTINFPTTSNGITGSWSPTPSTATLGTTVYTFTPNPGQCVTGGPFTHSLTVVQNATPQFTPIGPICAGSTPPALPTTSLNGVTGTWSPATVSNTASGTYTFTPNPGQCGSTTSINMTVNPAVTPTFNPIAPFCAGSAAPILPTTSTNGITGSWNPAVVNNTTSDIYTFTPDAGQCASTVNMSITVTTPSAIGFQNNLNLCQGSTPPALSNTSPTGVSGSWSPAVINTATVGTTSYTFTASPGQCAATTTHILNVTIDPVVTPDFDPVAPFCAGEAVPLLPGTSNNGVVGTWSPAVINDTTSGTYTFTPDAGQCATQQTLDVTVIPRPMPTFTPIAPFCAGSEAPVLNPVSNNGFTGSWDPPVIDNTATNNYLWTPDPGQCVSNLMLTVVVTPPTDPDFSDIEICINSTPPALESVSPNGISGTWFPSTIGNITGGNYIFTPNPGECANPQVIQVTVHPDQLTSIDFTVSHYFSDSHTITVFPQTPGTYLYQLNYGPIQESNVFTNVAPGTEHFITVIDPNGCSEPITIENIVVVGYPPYFTPNGDGYNDLWNVYGLGSESTVHIFDRFGKLIKQISPGGAGWDGTYNGEPLPATDYWFKVSYPENGVRKEFKSHFSLKR